MPKVSRRPRLASAGLALGAALGVALAAVLAPAQELPPTGTVRVAAVVNQDAVTAYDLSQRIGLGLLAAALPATDENYHRLAPEVLRRLIDEHLQMQEADRLKITVADSEIDDRIAELEKQNNMPKGGLPKYLTSRGVDPGTLRDQVRAQISWGMVVRHELIPNVRIGEDEINARLAELRANLGRPEYLGSDLYLAVEDPAREGAVRELAARLVDQLHHGAPFAELAHQFSQFAAETGGNLGWVSRGMIDDTLFRTLSGLQKNQISDSVRTRDGYHILQLRDRRTSGEGQDNEPTYDLAQIDLSLLPSANEAQRQTQLQSLRSTLAGAKTCDSYEARVRGLPTAQYSHIGLIHPSDIAPQVLVKVRDLEAGQMSEAVTVQDMFRLFVMCDRTAASKGLPSRDDIRRRIQEEKVELAAERYLRDLRRAAFVEIRA